MKKLILSAMTGTALFSNIAFAETHFKCANIESDGQSIQKDTKKWLNYS